MLSKYCLLKYWFELPNAGHTFVNKGWRRTSITTIEDASRGTAATLSFRLNFWDWLWCHQQIVSVKIGHHWSSHAGVVCLASSEWPTPVGWISMSARLTEWSAEWLTQLMFEWLTSTSAADWNCQAWKSLMQIRRIGLSSDLKNELMVDAEVDWKVDWQVNSMVH